MATTEAANKEIVRRVSEEAFAKGNLNVIDEHFAEDFVAHNPALPDGFDGREGYKKFIRMVRSAFPDLESTTEALIAEDDTVVERHVATGTHDGEFMEIEPTGKRVQAEGISIIRFDDGQIVEAWEQADMMGLLQQLGVVESP